MLLSYLKRQKNIFEIPKENFLILERFLKKNMKLSKKSSLSMVRR